MNNQNFLRPVRNNLPMQFMLTTKAISGKVPHGFFSYFCFCHIFVPKAESFYYVNYGSSIIMSKVSQIISVMKT